MSERGDAGLGLGLAACDHGGTASSPARHPAGRARGGWFRPRAARAAVALAVAGVLAQIGYPLLTGTALRTATVLAVVLLCAAAVAHAAAVWSPGRAAVVLAVAGGGGLVAEAVGVATGFPFGHYAYAGTLGPQLLGVPVIVPLAWTMLGYPCLLLGRRLAGGARRRLAHPLAGALGGFTLASWDLFLDPQMVARGHWVWAPDGAPGLPGLPGIPVTNYAGWLAVSVLIVSALDRLLPASPDAPADEAVPAGVLAWTWAGSTVGNLAFFDRPWVAAWGGLAMGATVLPYLARLRRGGER